jgi:uncharacterized protein YfkK (UPF0435 family)
MTNKSDSKMQAIADDLRNLYKADQQHAEILIETYLMGRLSDYSPDEKLTIVEEIAHQFEHSALNETLDVGPELKELKQLYAVLFGDKIISGNLSPEEMNKNIAESLNTVFDTVNQIIRVIHTTLLGETGELQTIRKIIGSQVEGQKSCDSLKCYLDQIQEAFLVSHQAFQEAATTKVAQILSELDPVRIAQATDKGLKFGPLYKAELFEAYKSSYQSCRTWFESNRFRQDLLREFEKICQKSFKMRARSTL